MTPRLERFVRPSVGARLPAALALVGRVGAERAVLRRLRRLSDAALDVRTPGAREVVGRAEPGRAPPRFVVHDRDVFVRVLMAGDVGLAEAYRDGLWDCDDLPAFFAALLAGRAAIDAVADGRGPARWLLRLVAALRRNTRQAGRRHVQAHYDLGNAFYRRWLDPSMSYSSAWWGDRPGLTLEQAQRRKVERALDEAGVAAGTRLLEIGCGWGALAAAAARRGARVTAITLSDEQAAWARDALRGAGLHDAATLRLEDYRDAAARGERFDAVVSIEMIEAVGRAYWPAYFDALARVLAPGGRAVVQSILVRDEHFERYARTTDFIRQLIFPGGMLPSDARLREHAAAAGLRIESSMAFGADYARTLALWRAAFDAAAAELDALGCGAPMRRLWRLYLAACEAAFATGHTDVAQYTLVHA